MEDILIINGATREHGNTDAIIAQFIAGACRTGHVVHNNRLRLLHIANCIGCCQCKYERRCNFGDDMTQLRERVMAADIIVCASPLYFCGVTGMMKTFLDRLYYFYHPENKHLVAGTMLLVITTMGQKEAKGETAVLEEFYVHFARALDMVLLPMVYFTDLMERDATKNHPLYLTQAYELGLNLEKMKIEKAHVSV